MKIDLKKGLATLCVLIVSVSLVIDGILHEPWSLRAPVHAAIFLFFLLLYITDKHDIGLAFLGTSACCYGHFCSNKFLRVVILFVGILALSNHKGTRCPSALLSLLAAVSAIRQGDSLGDEIAFSAHRAFMCSLGFSSSKSMRSGAILAQTLLAICYALHHSLEATCFAIGAVVVGLAEIYKEIDSYRIEKDETRVLSLQRTLPILKLKMGRLVFLTSLAQAGVMHVDQYFNVPATGSITGAFTQPVHVAAVLASVLVLAPSMEEQNAIKAVFFLASLADAGACYLRREGSSTPVILLIRPLCDLATASAYALTKKKLVGEPVNSMAATQTSRSLAWAAIMTFAGVHIALLVIWREPLDDSIAFAFHYPFLTTMFASWAMLWSDSLPWYLCVIFCITEIIAMLPKMLDFGIATGLGLISSLTLTWALQRIPTAVQDSFVMNKNEILKLTQFLPETKESESNSSVRQDDQSSSQM